MKINYLGKIQAIRDIWNRWPGQLGLYIFFLFIGFSSCKKDSSTTDTPAEREAFAALSSQADAEAEMIFDNVFDDAMGVSDEVAVGGTGVFETAGTGCFTVTYIQATANRFPLKVVIDFGAGCTGNDGRIRKGKINIIYTGRLIIPGNSATTTFEDYYVNDVQVEGIHKITNTGSQDKRSYTIQVTGARLSRPNGNFSLWNSEKTITQTEGLLTPLIALDDVFTISGRANGSVKKGDKYLQWATQISEPLTKKFACRWIVKGVLSLNKGNTKVAVLDYGTGGCDNKATFTVNGAAHEITLH